MQLHHRHIPERADGKEQHEAQEDMDGQQFPETPFPCEEHEDDEPRQAEADRPLRQHGNAREREGEIIPALLAPHIAKKERDEHARERGDERRIRDDGMADIPALDRRAEDDGRDEADALAEQPSAEAIRQQHAHDAPESRKEPRSKIRDAESLERRDELPVEEHGLVIPVIAVDARRDVIASADHLFGRQRVVRLHGIRDGKAAISDEIEQDAQKQQEDDMPPPFVCLSDSKSHEPQLPNK